LCRPALGIFNQDTGRAECIETFALYIDKLSDVNEEVEKMVKTFYDPKVAEKSAQMATLRTKREAIFELLEDVGNISDEVKALVEKEEDFDILKKWHKIAARVGSIDEFMDKVRVH
jgi:hypothetical protein